MNDNNRTLGIILVVIVVVIIIGLVVWSSQKKDMKSGDNNLPVLNVFDEKIVYTTDTSLNEQVFRSDCQERVGVFNSCGTICAADTEVCPEVCAYTCEFAPQKNATSTL